MEEGKKTVTFEDQNVKRKMSKKKRQTKKAKPMSIKRLINHKKYFEALANSSDNDRHEIMQRMGSKEMKAVSCCVHDLLCDKGVMKDYFSHDEAEKMKDIVKPWSKRLRAFTSQSSSLAKRRKLLGSKQKGGQGILASVIGALLPMAVHAISKWMSGGEKK